MRGTPGAAIAGASFCSLAESLAKWTLRFASASSTVLSFDVFRFVFPTHSSKDECRGTFENAQAKSWMHQNIACSKCLQMKLMQSDAVRCNPDNREREREHKISEFNDAMMQSATGA